MITPKCFNPRTRVGCDYYRIATVAKGMFQSTHPCGVRHLVKGSTGFATVSIHAPVWGATQVGGFLWRKQCFNPRTRVGCDRQIRRSVCGWAVSIHAPVWGATNVPTFRREAGGFNPRTRVGCDVNKLTAAAPLVKFQSTHPCGVRQYVKHIYLRIKRFNPRTRVGCDKRFACSYPQ